MKEKAIKTFGTLEAAEEILQSVKFWNDTKNLNSRHNGRMAKGRVKSTCKKYNIDLNTAVSFYNQNIK